MVYMSNAFYSLVYFIILLAILGGVFYIVNETYQDVSRPCKEPLGYAIGDVDSRFELDNVQMLRALAEAEKIWEDASGTDIFRYDPEAALKIHLIFDQRQQETLEIKDFEQEFNQKDEVYEQKSAEVDDLKARYEEAFAQFELLQESYLADLNTYNQEVEELNQQGGADEQQQEELEQRRDELGQEFDEVESQRQIVNQIVSEQQVKVEELNTLAGTLNERVENFNQSYGQEKIFDQGLYGNGEIVIYQYTEFEDLILVLAHELGHARGFDHVSDPDAVMHEIFNGDSQKQNSVTQADRQELEKACNPDVSFFDLQSLLQR